MKLLRLYRHTSGALYSWSCCSRVVQHANRTTKLRNQSLEQADFTKSSNNKAAQHAQDCHITVACMKHMYCRALVQDSVCRPFSRCHISCPSPFPLADGTYIGKLYNRQLESAPHKAVHHPPGAVDQTPAGAEGANQHHLSPHLQLHCRPGLHRQSTLCGSTH